MITFTCGLLIVLVIGTSNIQSYQAVEPLEAEIVSQSSDSGQVANRLSQIRECNRGCSWLPSALRFFCDYIEIPDFNNGGDPSCYRKDWDIDDDGVMEGPPENTA